jgi:crotonobetaine/carnitine-CoA ligase
VRIAWGAGATQETWRAFEARFGVQLCEVYGMTEASSLSTANPEGRVASMGRPLPGMNVQLVDGDHRQVPSGASGEIRIRTDDPGLMTSGYLDEPEATARLLPGDGWLYTGDAARADPDGFLYFVGRLADSLRVGGENVSAWEIETVIAAHPAVTDCAVVGVPGDLGEQDIKLFVQREVGQQITEAELVAWCVERLARHQVPRYVSWVREFPRTPSQRIVKGRLPTGTQGCWDRLARTRTP